MKKPEKWIRNEEKIPTYIHSSMHLLADLDKEKFEYFQIKHETYYNEYFIVFYGWPQENPNYAAELEQWAAEEQEYIKLQIENLDKEIQKLEEEKRKLSLGKA